MKRKLELLMKAGCLLPEQIEKNIMLDNDAPPISLQKDFGKVKAVHFNYIDSITPDEKIGGEPEGV